MNEKEMMKQIAQGLFRATARDISTDVAGTLAEGFGNTELVGALTKDSVSVTSLYATLVAFGMRAEGRSEESVRETMEEIIYKGLVAECSLREEMDRRKEGKPSDEDEYRIVE